MSVFLFISSTTLIGLAISLLIKREGISILRLLASIYGIGTAVISFELFLYFVIFRQSFNQYISWVIIAQAVVGLVIIIRKIQWQKQFSFDFSRIKIFSWLLGFLLVAILFFSLVQALGKPPVAFDNLAFWAMRAEILLKQGSVDFNSASPTYLSALSHSNYPWHLSLTEYWARLLGLSGGALNLIAWLYFVSLALLVIDFATKRLGQTKGLILSLFLCSQPLIFYHASNNYADLIVGYYLAFGLAFFFDWLDHNKLPYLVLAGIFIGWTFSIKNYGSFYIGALLFGLALSYLFKIKRFVWRDILIGLISIIGPILPLALFKLFFRLNLRNTDPQQVWHPETIKEFGRALFVSGNWNVWWVIFIVGGLTLLLVMRKEKKLWVAWLMFSSIIVILLGVFTLTENYMWAIDHTALSRAFIPLVPFSVLLFSYSLEKYEHRSSHLGF